MKKIAVLCMLASLFAGGCTMSTMETSGSPASGTGERAITGANGSVDVTGMTGTGLTVSYNAGTQLSYARLYVSEGNGTGLVLAARDMNYSGGVYSYTLSHPTFTPGARIYLTVLKNQNGVEACVPQGTLSNTASWASFTYGSSTGGSTGTVSSDLVNGGVYKIVAKCSGKALDVSDVSKTPGANVHQWDYVGGDNQKWKLLSAGDGYWYLESVNSGLVLDGAGWGTADGTNVVQWNRGNLQANQKFKIEANGDGTYRLTNQHANKVLDVSNSSQSNGGNVQLWTWNSSTAQRWTFTRLDSGSTGGSTGGSSDATTPSISGYRVAWSDEFNGTSLNTASWSYETGAGGWGNNELQYYTSRSQNVSVADGSLRITALKENYNGASWTSARIKTQGKRDFQYGKIQARIKMPNGTGLWPAFWMLGSNISSVNWPMCGEIDIMEHVNSEATTHGTIHWDNGGHANWGQPTNNNYWNNFSVDVTQWHEYSIEWDSSLIKWYVDGKQYMEANIAGGTGSTEEFHRPFFFLLNLAVGGQWPGYPDGSTPSSSTMYVDYVRVYQK